MLIPDASVMHVTLARRDSHVFLAHRDHASVLVVYTVVISMTAVGLLRRPKHANIPLYPFEVPGDAHVVIPFVARSIHLSQASLIPQRLIARSENSVRSVGFSAYDWCQPSLHEPLATHVLQMPDSQDVRIHKAVDAVRQAGLFVLV